MSYACAIDCDPCELYEVTEIKKARIEHRCAFCEMKITPGSPYNRLFSVFDGDPYVEKWHSECEALMRLAGDLICGDSVVAFGSTLDGASNELLSLQEGKWDSVSSDDVKDWMLKYGEILEKYDA